jgi:amino acid permease
MKEKVSGREILNNWLKFAVIVGIIPWAYYYVTHIGPVVNHALGIDKMPRIKAGVYILPIVIPPLLLYSWLSRNDKDEKA